MKRKPVFAILFWTVCLAILITCTAQGPDILTSFHLMPPADWQPSLSRSSVNVRQTYDILRLRAAYADLDARIRAFESPPEANAPGDPNSGFADPVR